MASARPFVFRRNAAYPRPAKPRAIIAQVDGSGTLARLNSNAFLVEVNVTVVNAPRPLIATTWLQEGNVSAPPPDAPNATRSAPVNVQPSTEIESELLLSSPPWFPSI